MAKPVSSGFGLLLLALLTGLWLPAAATAQWQIESPDGEAQVKFGFLAQLRADSIEGPNGGSASQDLYFRRLRFLVGGKISDRWSFFFETDSPNLGKGTDGGKVEGDVFVQDAFFTYHHSEKLKVDAGMILIPLSHNSQQSAASLLTLDYLPYSFVTSGPTRSRVGRDYGVQLRGYVANDHLEYRLGVYQGERGPGSTNEFRTVGRLVYYPFEADKGFYYTGTTLGERRILALGAGYDTQEDYEAWSVDLFWDQPLGRQDGVTVQAALFHGDGHGTFPELAEQDALQIELGYFFGAQKLMPFASFAHRDPEAAPRLGEDRLRIGLAWLPKGHRRSLKVAWGRLEPDQGAARDQLIAQLQLFAF